jgi:predicted transcriptional regulator
LLQRDVKSVHRDVKPLSELGLIESGERGLFVPYDEIRAEFTMRRKAA